MKLIYQSSDKQAVEASRLLLESRGIPVHISNDDTNRNLSYMSVAVQVGIWVVFDDQYLDAVALLKDDAHDVANPRDVDEYRTSLNNAETEMRKSGFDRVMLGFMLLLIAGIVTYFVSKITHS
ncbi:hypothetical protein [Gynuella sp.]|uniref:hypothetical protein n=1 Tax=Gynuella sp. TaxID=2969146 RepID=UPI003D10BDC5